MTVKELQGILDRIVDKNAPIEFEFNDYYKDFDENDIPTADIKINGIQDDSYFKDEGYKRVIISFQSPELKIDTETDEEELEDFYKKDIPVFLCGALDEEWAH